MFGKTSAVLFTVTAAALSVSALQIDTPKKLTQCGTVTLNWSGRKAPYVLTVLPSCESDIEEPFLELPPINATTYQWTVNLPAKTGSIAFAITDAGGNEAYTDEIDIGSSDVVACLTSASSSIASSAASSIASSATSSIASSATSSIASSATPTGTITDTSSGQVLTTLVVSATSVTSTPSAPVNAGSGVGGNSGVTNNKVNGALANTVPFVASIIGVATGLLALF